MKSTIVILIVCLFCFCGCYSAFTVHEKDGKDAAGIPFYLYKSGTTQQTTWMEPYYHIAVSIDTLQSPAPKEVWKNVFNADKDVSYKTYQENIYRLKRLADEVFHQDSHYKDFIEMFGKLSRYDAISSHPDTTMLISNELTATKYVDYQNPYYLNTKRPWIGTTELTAELNTDGTLSKATSHVESKTVETILGAVSQLFPVKDFLTSQLIPAEKSLRLPVRQPVFPQARIIIKTDSREVHHVLSRLWFSDTNPGTLNPISKDKRNEPGYSYKRIVLSSKQDEGDKKDDAKSIDVSGKIILPKEKE